MNIIIIGGGAIGLLFYQGLYKYCQRNTNASVSLLSRKPLTNISVSNLSHFSVVMPIREADQALFHQADAILICTKAYQTADIINAIKDKISPTTALILAHNGMGTIDECSHINNPIYALLTTHGSKRIHTSHILHTGIGTSDLGLIQGSETTAKSQQLCHVLNQALPKVSFHQSIQQKQWLKLAINCVINPLTAIYHIKNGELLKPQYQTKISNLITEFLLIAQAEQLNFTQQQLTNIITDVAKKTAANTSSMYQDVLQQRTTEIDYINGYLLKLAAKHQIPLPHHQEIYQLITSTQYLQ